MTRASRPLIMLSVAALLVSLLPIVTEARPTEQAKGAPNNVYLGGYLLGAATQGCMPLTAYLHNRSDKDIKVTVEIDLVRLTADRRISTVLHEDTVQVTAQPTSSFATLTPIESDCSGSALSSGDYGYVVRIFNTGGHHLLHYYGPLAPFHTSP